jgi:hypothetical protein
MRLYENLRKHRVDLILLQTNLSNFTQEPTLVAMADLNNDPVLPVREQVPIFGMDSSLSIPPPYAPPVDISQGISAGILLSFI